MQAKLKHLAVIMDGNRRWAKQRGLPSIEGHRVGVKALKNLVALCPQYGIEYLTVYAFSTENWRRSANELEFLFKLLGEVAVKELSNLNDKNVRVKFLGDLEAFASYSIKEELEALEKTTESNDGLNLQIALNYGSLDEMAMALNKVKASLSSQEIEKLSPEEFSQYLYTAEIPDPELMVRTGGDARLSNYLLWQLADAELAFLDTLWPDFSEDDLKQLVAN